MPIFVPIGELFPYFYVFFPRKLFNLPEFPDLLFQIREIRISSPFFCALEEFHKLSQNLFVS